MCADVHWGFMRVTWTYELHKSVGGAAIFGLWMPQVLASHTSITSWKIGNEQTLTCSRFYTPVSCTPFVHPCCVSEYFVWYERQIWSTLIDSHETSFSKSVSEVLCWICIGIDFINTDSYGWMKVEWTCAVDMMHIFPVTLVC